MVECLEEDFWFDTFLSVWSRCETQYIYYRRSDILEGMRRRRNT